MTQKIDEVAYTEDTSEEAYTRALQQRAGNGRPVIAAKKPRKRAKSKSVAAVLRDPQEVGMRMYHGARSSRLTGGLSTLVTSADAELVTSLRSLRSFSRQLVRDSAFAKRAKVIIQNNVIGSGIGMQAQVQTTRGDLRDDVNDALEEKFSDWSCGEYCHTGGVLGLADMERALMGQVFEAGEVFVRSHYRAFGGYDIPLALELIESERIADELNSPVQPAALIPGNVVRQGIEQDRFGRPVAYFIRLKHPGDYNISTGEIDRIERVPAEQIKHLKITDRWPQTRGEPWMHAVIRKLNDMDGYTEAEIIAARGGANYLAALETEGTQTALAQLPPGATDGKREIALEPGTVVQLLRGEKMTFLSPNRPNSNLESFMRYMVREMAAGVGCSYESLSRDYSQSNYSSSRLSLLDDRDLWRMFQGWFIRNFRLPLHKEWLQIAMLARAISNVSPEEYFKDTTRFQKVLFKPRGWGWIDPTKEVEAYKEAVRAGFTTQTDVIANTGGGQDIEDVFKTRKKELELAGQLGLNFDTSPDWYMMPGNTATGPKPGAGNAKEGRGDEKVKMRQQVREAIDDIVAEGDGNVIALKR